MHSVCGGSVAAFLAAYQSLSTEFDMESIAAINGCLKRPLLPTLDQFNLEPVCYIVSLNQHAASIHRSLMQYCHKYSYEYGIHIAVWYKYHHKIAIGIIILLE